MKIVATSASISPPLSSSRQKAHIAAQMHPMSRQPTAKQSREKPASSPRPRPT
jgi:hypothetical protein